MPDFCENCNCFSIENKRLKGFNNNIPKKDKKLSDYIPQYKCILGHRLTKNKYKQIVPYTKDYMCDDFIEK
jgi:hypothetical protein